MSRARPVVCVLLPFGFLGLGLARMRAAGGAAMVATPSELLVRTQAGIHRVAFASVLALDVTSRRTFTMLGGSALERALVVEREDGAPIRFDEALLGDPIEVVVAMIEAYSDGVGVPVSADSASQGSGGGGGISGTEGTTT